MGSKEMRTFYKKTPQNLPLVPSSAHHSERQDEPFSLQIQRLEGDVKLNCGFLFFAPWALMGQLIQFLFHFFIFQMYFSLFETHARLHWYKIHILFWIKNSRSNTLNYEKCII